MDRDEWNKHYSALLDEMDAAERAKEMTAAIMCGRLSIVIAMETALNNGATLEDFLNIMQYVVAQELITGTIDEDTFQIPEDITNYYDGEPGV